MKKHLMRALAAVLALGLFTASYRAVIPTVIYPNLMDSPFIPVFSSEPPPPPAIDTPFVPDFCFTR